MSFFISCSGYKHNNSFVKKGIEPRSEKDVVWQNYLIKIKENSSQKKAFTNDVKSKTQPTIDYNKVYNVVDRSDSIQTESTPKYMLKENLVDINEFIQAHILKNFKYPEFAQEYEIQGKVNTYCEIDQEGNFHIKNVNGPKYGLILEEEAIRILSLVPKAQTPAIQRGTAVKVTMSIPIMFKLN